jgi:AcrR family transcriptional regulator
MASTQATEVASPRKSERTRRAVLDAAARLFARRGYAGTNLSDIAAEAGIKTGSLYYHFESKDELVSEVLRFGTAHSHEHAQAAVDALGTRSRAVERLRAAIEAHLASLHHLGDYALAGLRIVEQAPQPIRRNQYANQRRYGEYWEALLEAARAEGALPESVELLPLRLFLFDAMNGTVTWPASARRSTRELADTLMRLVTRA